MFAKIFVGEALSQIYSPFYVTDKVFDAVLNVRFHLLCRRTLTFQRWREAKPDWRIEFIPTLCPNCGWILEGEKNALVLSCKNCNSCG